MTRRHAMRDDRGWFAPNPRGDRLLPDRVGQPLSPNDRAAVRAYALTANYKLAAASLGMPVTTLQTHLHRAYMRLGVDHGIDAFRELGWLKVPDA